MNNRIALPPATNASAGVPSGIGTKPKKSRKVEHCQVDFAKKAIIITKDFGRRASVIGSPEFKRLSELCNAYPHLEIITRTAKRNTSHSSVKGLTRDFMEKYVTTLYPDDREIYELQLKTSEAFRSPYMYMRNWFTKRYPEWAQYKVPSEQKEGA